MSGIHDEHTPEAIGPNGIELLEEFEGLRLLAYRCPAGYLTIGIGHKLTPSELSSGKLYLHDQAILYRHGLNFDQVKTLLYQDLDRFETWIYDSVHVPLNQHQFDSLVCWAFNVGEDAVYRSTLRKRLNAGDYEAVPTQLRRWVYSGGRKVNGLKRRREAEVALWLTPMEQD